MKKCLAGMKKCLAEYVVRQIDLVEKQVLSEKHLTEK